MDGLGFAWKHRDRGRWEDRYQELVEFRDKHGHCNVPFEYEEVPKLGAFVNNSRTQKSSGKLSQERIQLLELIGFQWTLREDALEKSWEIRYSQIAEFKAIHGHCKVPTSWPEDPSLGRWVSHQRHLKKSRKLDPKREQMLNAIGFDWEFFESTKDLWTLRYMQLVDFKNQNGHCVVPYNFAANPQLGIWVANQRSKRKQNKLTPERERLLNEIGFSWTVT